MDVRTARRLADIRDDVQAGIDRAVRARLARVCVRLERTPAASSDPRIADLRAIVATARRAREALGAGQARAALALFSTARHDLGFAVGYHGSGAAALLLRRALVRLGDAVGAALQPPRARLDRVAAVIAQSLGVLVSRDGAAITVGQIRDRAANAAMSLLADFEVRSAGGGRA